MGRSSVAILHFGKFYFGDLSRRCVFENKLHAVSKSNKFQILINYEGTWDF